MKSKVARLFIVATVISPLTQAAIHNGKVIDGKTYICSGTYIKHFLRGGKDFQREIRTAQCIFSGSTLTVQSSMYGGTGTVDLMHLGNPVFSYKIHESDGYIDHWHMMIDWNSNSDNYNQMQ